MHGLFVALSALAGIVSFICWIVILVDAFKDSLLKGLIGLFCGIYLVYYGIFEFEHKNKLAILIFAFLGGAIAVALRQMG